MSFKKQIATFLTTFAALIAGVAFAAWTATGTGSGSAKAGSSSALVITATGTTPTASLYPNGSAPIYMKVSNPNPFKVQINQLTAGAGNAVTSDNATCTTNGTGVTLAPQNPAAGTGLTLPASSVSNDVVVNAAAAMDNTSDNACQGATFTFSAVTLTGTSTP
jgi:hypothetical protein